MSTCKLMSFPINAVDAEVPDSAICGKCKDKELLYKETGGRGQGDRIFNPSPKNPNPILITKGKKKEEKKAARRKEKITI